MKRTNLLLMLVFVCWQAHSQKIGILIHSHVDDRWKTDQRLLEQEITRLGGEPMVRIADEDAGKQVAQAVELMDAGAKVLIVAAVDAVKAIEIVDKAMDNGVKVLSYDRLILSSNIAAYLSYDSYQVGVLQAQSAVKGAPKGEYILLNGPVSDYNAVQFRLGQLSVLDPKVKKGDITIKEDIVLENWGEINAFVSLLNIFSDIQEVEAVIAANDGIALAVNATVDDLDVMKGIYLTGQDADLAAIQNIQRGLQDMTVYKPIAPLAKKASVLAMELANGKKTTLPKMEIGNVNVRAELLSPQVVNKDNIESTVIADGHIKKSDLKTDF